MGRTVLVCGAMANKPRLGGEAWVRLNWLLGLRRLGCTVYFVEQIASSACVDRQGRRAAFEASDNLQYFREVVDSFGLEGVSSLLCDEGRSGYGLTRAEVEEIAGSADVLVNISGHLTIESILRRARLKAYVDLDPGFTQIWHAQGLMGGHLAAHDFHFTVGENIGTDACCIPTGGFAWQRKRRFVVLDCWPVVQEVNSRRFTTVGAWRGSFGAIEHDGRRFGLKVHEFRKLLALPRLAPQTFELALAIHPADDADRVALRRHGWIVTEPAAVAGDPHTYRRYVQESGGECSAAQGIYVETTSGWLSDRTVRYLASGRPALVQDTGFGRNLPVGEGLVPFRTLDEAVAGAHRIAANYDTHARAARRLAEAYFDSDKVLPEMFDGMGLPL